MLNGPTRQTCHNVLKDTEMVHSYTDASSKGTKEDQNLPLEFTLDIAAKCLKTYFNIDSATMCLKMQLSWEV